MQEVVATNTRSCPLAADLARAGGLRVTVPATSPNSDLAPALHECAQRLDASVNLSYCEDGKTGMTDTATVSNRRLKKAEIGCKQIAFNPL